MYIVAQLDNDFLIVVARCKGLVGIDEPDMMLAYLFQILDVLGS